MNNKGKKTTIVAYIALTLIIALFVALFMEKITADDLWKGLGAISTGAVLFIGFLSKDSTATHTIDKQAIGGEIPPDDDEDPPQPPQ